MRDGDFEDREQRASKPFRYIPFANRCERKTPAGHDTYAAGLLSGEITGAIVALTPLHVASGGIELMEKVDWRLAQKTPLIKAFVRSGGKRVIPGSSLKGSMRAIVEAITPSCVAKTGRGTRTPGGLGECREQGKLCPACRIFGALGYLGQVQFSDAEQVGNAVEITQVPGLFAPRTRGEVRGRKFYKHGTPTTGNTPTEAVPVDTRFEFSVRFENLLPEELGVLLIALGQGAPALHPKLGGGKPACYGSAEFRDLQVSLAAGREAWISLEAPSQLGNVADYVSAALAARDLVLQEQLNFLAKSLEYPGKGPCPTGVY